MKKAARPYGGRPKRDPLPGERVPVSFRVTPDLKARLNRVAEESGRSISLEMEMRLQQSFEKEARLGGPDLANLAMLMLAAFSHAGAQYARANENPDSPKRWLQDPAAYGAAVAAVLRALIIGDPEADRETAGMRYRQTIISLARSIDAKFLNVEKFDAR